MALLIIDEDKCNKDGFCVRECPMAIIQLKEEDGFPELMPGGENICNACGHCVAICPYGALSHQWVPVDASPLIREDLEISEDQAVQFLRSRRSIRSFKDQPVEREKLQRLIEIARYAPSGGNRQPVNWTVFTNPDEIRGIAERTVAWMNQVLAKAPDAVPPYFPIIARAWDKGVNAVTWSAPVLIVASAPAEVTTGMVDVTLTLSYLDLIAPKLGLGTCWAGLVQGAMDASDRVRDLVGLPEGHPYYYPMMVGYPKPEYTRLPERNMPGIIWR